MEQNSNRTLWFKAKRYGYGWYPVTWQGWLITLTYCVGILLIAVRAVHITEMTENNGHTFLWNYLPPLIILSIPMTWICYKTGEKPGWKWNGK